MSFIKETPGIVPSEPVFDDQPKSKADIWGMTHLILDQQEKRSTTDKDYTIHPFNVSLSPEQLKLHHFPVHIKYGNKNLNFTRHHASLVHFWNEWYGEYYRLTASELPHLMVRMEDLLFFPDEVVPKMCECVGGKLRNATSSTGVNIPVTSTKSTGHKSLTTPKGKKIPQTGYVDALIKYGNPATRFHGHSPHDLQYASLYLDKKLMDAFRYQYPHPISKNDELATT